MTQKRVLPPRSNRGKRPEQTQQQIAKEDVLYNEIFEAAKNSISPREKVSKKIDNSQIQSQHRQYFILNKGSYPYSRGYHYFFDLNSFERVDGSVSYAFDNNNVFHSTFSQQNKMIKDGVTIGSVLNRKIFGLPTSEMIQIPKTKDKNICHVYLFQNEDRKFHIDRILYELKQILKNLDKLIQNNNLYNFNCLKKDIDLLLIYQNNISNQQKKNILIKKIKILQEKKQNIKSFLYHEDKSFFYHSLNQLLHDQIQQNILLLANQYIIGEIYYAEFQRQQLNISTQLKSQELSKIFYYYQTKKICLKQQTIQTMITKINKRFFKKSQNDGIYQISIPFIFLPYTNITIMQISQRILALKLAHQNQASFYICKMFWKRIFDRDLIVNKQMKPIAKIDYDKLMTQTLMQLNKWKKSKQKQPKKDQFIFPEIDLLINWNVFDGDSQITDLFSREKQVQINVRQYICLVLFYRLYLCISQIYEFILTNQNLSMLIANDYYTKAHNYIVECIGTARIGIMDEVLKKLTECIIRSDFDVNFKLRWVYNGSNGVAYITKTGIQSEWQTQKQDNQNEHNGNQEIIDNNEKKLKLI